MKDANKVALHISEKKKMERDINTLMTCYSIKLFIYIYRVK